MKRRVFSLLLALSLMGSFLPAAHAEREIPPVTALCASDSGGSARLDDGEFQRLCRYATGHDLESVTIENDLPARTGTLTYDGERVTAEQTFYPEDEPYLSQVRFTPYTHSASSRFTGRDEVAFTMTSDRDETVSGTLVLYVPEEMEEIDVPAEAVTALRVDAGTVVSLTDPLPTKICYKVNWYPSQGTSWRGENGDIYTEGDIDSLTFVLPSPSQGCLWLDYEYSTARKVLPGEVLYSDREPNCYSVTFVPAHKKGDKVQLNYFAASGKRTDLPGAVTIELVEKAKPKPTKPAEKPEPVGPQFQDLEGWDWAVPAIHFVAEQGYEFMSPTFRPGDCAARIEIIQALLAAADYPLGRSGDTPFTDLPNDAYLALKVNTAVEHGLVFGDGEGHLFPNDQVSRQDALVMLHRALDDKGMLPARPGDLSVFSDVGDLAPYAQAAAADLYALDVLRGDGTGRLAPLSPITRAEMACLLYRAFGNGQ